MKKMEKLLKKTEQLKNIFKNKKGEGYIDVVISIMVLLMVLVLTINIYSVMVLKQDLDAISDQLITVATSEGCFGTEFNKRVDRLRSEFFDFDYSIGADYWYSDESLHRVDFGKTMTVTVKAYTTFNGGGVFKIPINAQSTRSGISAIHWSSSLEEEEYAGDEEDSDNDDFIF